MKKLIKRAILVILIILIIRFFFFIFKTNHTYEYQINNGKEFSITELYQNKKYYFIIKMNEKQYAFTYDNFFYKQKGVIKKIEYYEKDDLLCIYPVLKKDKQYNIVCNENEKTYSYNYYKDELDSFISDLKDKGYTNDSWIQDLTTKRIGNAIVYQNNIRKDTYIYIWKYNGFYTINNKKINQLNVFKNDTYNNELGIRVGKYYIVPNYDDKYDYDKFYIFNMKNNKQKTLILKKNLKIDASYYNNGVVEDKLYLFDSTSLTQYAFNLKLNKYKVVGYKDIGGLYFNNDWEIKPIYEFKTDELIFNNIKIPSKLDSDLDIYNYEDNYYYLKDDNIILYNSTLDCFTYLFNMKNINSIKIVDNDLYFIQNNILYYYNEYTDLKPIVQYNELAFNKINRYEVYKK